MKLFFYYNIVLLLLLLLLETLSFLATKLTLFHLNEIPDIYRSKDFVDHSLWRNEKELWGAWHVNNQKTYHSSSCFSALYESNEIGARDKTFVSIKNDNKNIILLGDSMAEGYTVNYQDTAKYILEKNLKVNVLNFATAMNFGPVQYFIIYKELAKKYSHETVIIFFLPHNDFTDNNYESFVSARPEAEKRYRPYYKKISEDNYEIFYPEMATKRDSFDIFNSSKNNSARFFIKKYFFFNNLLTTINISKYNILNWKETRGYKSNILDTKIWNSGYQETDIEKQKAAIFFMKEIIKEASKDKKKVIIVSIPVLADIYQNKLNNSYKNNYWYQSLLNLNDKKKVFFIDLLEHSYIGEPEKFYQWCDGHWSPYGNKFAADILTNFINKESILK